MNQSAQAWPADSVSRVSVADLVPYARNARTHSDAQVAQIAASIREWGWTIPVLVDEAGTLIAGHGRLLAAFQLGIESVPAMRAVGWSEAKRRAYALADNKLALNAGWDDAMLAQELADLGEIDLSLTGFSPEEFADLLASLDDDEREDLPDNTDPQTDRADELREQWGVETGQLWQIGEHRILCGDSTRADHVAMLMLGESVSAVLTDPPYGQNQKGVDGDTPEDHARLMSGAIDNLPIKSGIVVAFQSPRTFHNWTDAARAGGFSFERMLWMYKAAQCTFPWRGWILKSEAIPVCSIGEPSWNEVNPYSHDCYYLSEVSGEIAEGSGWHGSVKPMSVISDLLSRITRSGDLVYEPFSGSGTTIIACENLGRKCRAIEISPAYVAVALQRWADHTGKTPVLMP